MNDTRLTDRTGDKPARSADDGAKDSTTGVERSAKLAPVIAIDGPSGSGKGTIASAVADQLGFFFLDSGALYRVVALASLYRKVPEDDIQALTDLARTAPIEFRRGPAGGAQVLLGGQNVTDDLRREHVGDRASRIAPIARMRSALLDRQRRWRRLPGLVADGRDMGTVVFPDAELKIFLTASAQVRAERRHKQLIEKGIEANIGGLLADINERDDRDMNRKVAPLAVAEGAICIDASSLTIEEVVTKVLDFAQNRI